MSFINKFWLIIDVIFCVCILSFYNISDVRYVLKNVMGEYGYSNLYDTMPVFVVFSFIISFFLLFAVIKKLIFSLNASYIEKSFTGQLVRIAKQCRLGLFDTKSKSVRLYSRYDSIDKFDDNHLLLSRKGKKGVYSIARKKIIIPVLFDSISAFTNSVCAATGNGITVHYDVKGNRLQ